MSTFRLKPDSAASIKAAAAAKGLTVGQYVEYLHESAQGKHLEQLIFVIANVVAAGPDHRQIAVLSALLTYLVELKVSLGFR